MKDINKERGELYLITNKINIKINTYHIMENHYIYLQYNDLYSP